MFTDFILEAYIVTIKTINSAGNEVVIDKNALNDGVSNYVFGLLVKIGSQTNYLVQWRPFTEKDGKRIYGDYREHNFKK